MNNRRVSHCSRVFLHDLTLRYEKKKHNVCFFFPLRGGIIYQKSPLFAVSIPATLQILYTFLVHLHQPRDRCDFFSPQRISLCICILYMQVARARVKVATGCFSTARTHVYLFEGAMEVSMHRRSALDNRALLSIFQPARAFLSSLSEIDISRLHLRHGHKRRIFVGFSARNNRRRNCHG